MAKTWESPAGDLELARGDGGDRDLQAWDGTDAHLVESLEGTDGPVLVVDDRFGGLALACAERCVGVWADHAPARVALAANAARNRRTSPPFVASTSQVPGAAVVLACLPRGLRRLEWLAARLAALPEGTRYFFGARSKDVQRSAVAVVEAALGPASTGLAKHRSRLISAVRDGRVAPEPSLRTWEVDGLVVRGLPGVFGEAKLDPGAAALVPAIAAWDAETVVDLGCGTGVLGAVAARRNPAATVAFRDASFLAVESARRTWEGGGLGPRATFAAADVLDGVPDRSVDVVLCNPPFHAGRTITRVVAHRMIRESARVLRPGGRLVLVGNRHLGYHQRLPKHFGAVRLARSDRRFVVFEATGPR